MKIGIMLTLLAVIAGSATGQVFTEKISKELAFEKAMGRTLMIFNINGSVNVTGYAGDKVLVEVEKTISAKTDKRLEAAKAKIQLGVMDRADTIMLYVTGTCSEFGRGNEKYKNNNERSNNWGYGWNDCNRQTGRCNEEFDYKMVYNVKVPIGINLYVSTINMGDLKVENISGQVSATNINGSITLNKISGSTFASTINGSVDLEYAQNPPKDCRYYSLNGDINANFLHGLKADVKFESFNGALYSNIDRIESMPVAIQKVTGQTGLRYKLGNNQFKVGAGGVMLDFETFNGNVYLKEN